MTNTSFDSIKAELHPYILSILSDICPGGKTEGRVYRAGTTRGGPGKSFFCYLDSGVWQDAATGEKGGDIISLYAHNYSMSQWDSAQRLQESYLGKPIKEPVQVPTKEVKAKLKLIKPPPNTMPPSNLHKFASHWVYTDENGNPIYYIVRKNNSDGTKDFYPYCYSENHEWISSITKEIRVPYNLQELANTEKKILIVEGEKAADAAKKELTGYTVTTWSGGANAVDQTSWDILKDKDVLLWPDNDEAGIACVNRLAFNLIDICKSVRILEVNKSDKPEKWDAHNAFIDENWTSKEFIAWAKPLVKEVEKSNLKANVSINKTKIKHVSRINFPFVKPTKNDVKVLNVIENFETLLDAYGIIIRNNLMTKTEEIIIPGEEFHSDNKENAQYGTILSCCNLHGMPTLNLDTYIAKVANANQYHPVVNWIKSYKWDGVDRVQMLFDTVKCAGEDQDPKKKAIKEMMMKRWLVSAVAAVFEPDGCGAGGVLVFQSEVQGLGKTEWFKSLTPKEYGFYDEGVKLVVDNKDSIMSTLSKWLIELGELDATFKKSEISALKGFLTKARDTYRAPFAKRQGTYDRRTVFFASVNPKDFLHDDTNRRFWVIECESINYKYDFDKQQMWAQVYEDLYLKGERWHMTTEERKMLEESNENFRSVDPVEELIQERLDWGTKEETWRYITSTELLIEVGKKNPTKFEVNLAAKVCRKLSNNPGKRTEKGRYIFAPNLKTEYRLQNELGMRN